MLHRKKWIIANWKMHGTAAMAGTWIDAVAPCAADSSAKAEVVVCPPATLIRAISSNNTGFEIRIGGQDCHPAAEGAFTGSVSAAMLKDAGCSYVIVGHSERRSQHGETNALVKQKAEAALAAALTPVVCVGETLTERQSGTAEVVVAAQLQGSLPQAGHFLLAYEPVWAIGTGHTPTVADIHGMHAFIHAQTKNVPPVVYGGSVNASNAREILTIDGVSGVLVGGASLKLEEFCKIIASA